MSKAGWFTEPIRFFNSNCLLSAKYKYALPKNTEIITNIEQAMALELSQDPPDGYDIWPDAVAFAQSQFYATENEEKVKEGEALINPIADLVIASANQYYDSHEFKIKRIKKLISEKEAFWLTVHYDIWRILRFVSLERYVLSKAEDSFYENTYSIFKAGFYQCGIKHDGNLIAFDAAVLQNEAGTGVGIYEKYGR